MLGHLANHPDGEKHQHCHFPLLFPPLFPFRWSHHLCQLKTQCSHITGPGIPAPSQTHCAPGPAARGGQEVTCTWPCCQRWPGGDIVHLALLPEVARRRHCAPGQAARGGQEERRWLVGCLPNKMLHCCPLTLVVFTDACSGSACVGHPLHCVPLSVPQRGLSHVGGFDQNFLGQGRRQLTKRAFW